MNTTNASESAKVASAGGTLAGKVASAADPARSMLGRVTDTAAAIQLATRVLPAGWRLVRRYPLGASLVILGLAWAAYSWRPTRGAAAQKDLH
jgi:hypothetical protein